MLIHHRVIPKLAHLFEIFSKRKLLIWRVACLIQLVWKYYIWFGEWDASHRSENGCGMVRRRLMEIAVFSFGFFGGLSIGKRWILPIWSRIIGFSAAFYTAWRMVSEPVERFRNRFQLKSSVSLAERYSSGGIAMMPNSICRSAAMARIAPSQVRKISRPCR